MSTVFPPRREADYLTWTEHYTGMIAENAEHYYLTPEDVTELQRHQTAFDKAYADQIDASDKARAATQAKKDARDALDVVVRRTAKRIMCDDRISDFMQKELGLPIHKTTRTPVPVPTSTPNGQVIATDRLVHRILVTDSDTPTKRRKPNGVIGCEAYVLVREVPSLDPEEYSLIGIWTRYPEMVEFKPEQAGQIAHYLFRWVNTRGERGPWSDVASATIPAV